MQEDPKFDSGVRKIPWRREWQPTPVFLAGVFHGQRSLVGYSSWGHQESNTTEWLTLSLSYVYKFVIHSLSRSTEFFSVHFSHSVVSDSSWPHDCSMPGFPVLHQLLELVQTHVHRVSDSIQPSHSLLSPSPPAFNLSQPGPKQKI